MQPTLLWGWRRNRFGWMPRPIRRWCASLPDNWRRRRMDRKAERTGAKIMASVASVYARAFADVILDVKLEADQALTELRTLLALLAQSVALRRVWENPAIPAEQKRGLLDAIAQRDEISRPVRNLVAVLIDHRRVPFLKPIVQQVEKEINQRMGFAEAQITSAR